MIISLAGILREKSPAAVALEVNGLTFELLISFSTFSTLGELDAPASLFTHLYFREDAITLFGFATRLEKSIFLKLIGVSGIGPKLAIAILSALPPSELLATVCEGNARRLATTPGIGKKTAERIILELRDAFLKLTPAPQSGEAPPAPTLATDQHRLADDLVSALTNLGWQAAAVEKVVTQTLRETNERDFEKAFKEALKRLYR